MIRKAKHLERMPATVAALFAAWVGYVFFFASYLLVFLVIRIDAGEDVAAYVALGIAALISCLVGWVVYPAARWRRPDEVDRLRCNSCGYNLTGNVSGVCPECGRAIDERTPAQRG